MNTYSIDKILASPHTAPMPEEGTILETLCVLLGKYVTPENFHNIIIYADRLPEEYNVLLIKNCIARTYNAEKLTDTKIFIDWANRHSEILT